ncbi:MAG: shikimate kinase [Bryobacterales bacterium]|jgi:shikimate kinase|nr:shikimate kinase [Bryobacterales bacterium]
MILKLVRTPGVYLLGFMGSGKSTIGRKLAEGLGWDFYDLDDDIERQAGRPIAEIFSSDGEDEFRRMEREALDERVRMVQAGHAMVLALGGGACLNPPCLERLKNNGVTVFLDCDFSVLAQRVAQFQHRPLAKDPERFRALYDQRRPLYLQAEYTVNTGNCSEEEVMEAILRLGVF